MKKLVILSLLSITSIFCFSQNAYYDAIEIVENKFNLEMDIAELQKHCILISDREGLKNF
ncbi:MAG: hypothetical protein KAR57_00835 [Bacteroidales bacterium]|nr:hypothetical protein [Bacteroidales bacterium]